MQPAAAAAPSIALIAKANPEAPAFRVSGRHTLVVSQELRIDVGGLSALFDDGASITLPDVLTPGQDYEIVLNPDSSLSAHGYGAASEFGRPVVGGFHNAPGGNALGREGGDDVPAINPFSIYDLNWRPACTDPRGMTLVDGRFWADIYLLGVNHAVDGTSRCGVPVAHGRSLAKLDYPTTAAIYAEHGKQLMGVNEFFAAAFGVTEKTSRRAQPKLTGLTHPDDCKFTSQSGLNGAAGWLWVWGHDEDPDTPRASIFGGSWYSGGGAGSRDAYLGCWPGDSYDIIGARGRSDHLTHAQ